MSTIVVDTLFSTLPLMILLNYSHPLTEAHLDTIARLTDDGAIEVRDIPSQLDVQAPLAPQVAALVDAAALSAAQWQAERLLVNPPALNYSAALLLAELHGRMGYFPPLLRLRPVVGALPPRFEVAEILNLQVQRDAARKRR